MKKIIIALSLLLGILMLNQTIRAQTTVKKADKQYQLYNYSKDVDLYLKAYKAKKSYAIEQHLATSYYEMRDYKTAETWYAKLATRPENTPEDLYRYAEVLKTNAKYADAKEQYIRYYAMRLPVDTIQLNYWLSSCDSAVHWIANPTTTEIKNEVYLNTPKSDWGAVKFGNNVVFASDKVSTNPAEKERKAAPLLKIDGNKGPDRFVYGWTGNAYLDLYQSVYSSTSANTTKVFPIDAGTDYHVGPASFTADGSEMYFTLTEVPKNLTKTKKDAEGVKVRKEKDDIRTIHLEIFYSKLDRNTGKWGKPKPFAYNNPSKWSVGDPFVSADGSTLFFTSDMPGGMGGTDIYYSTRVSGGTWQSPTNLVSVNTTGDERTPVLHDNDFYFSSDGQKGMGGLDVFRSTREAKMNTFTYSKPVNMGTPVNSPMDDFAFNPTDSVSGYFSSNRVGGTGSDDIYSYKLHPIPELKLEGIVYNRLTRAPIPNAIVTLKRAEGGNGKFITDNSGNYHFKIAVKNNYKIKAEKEGYLADNKALSTMESVAPATLHKDLYLDRIELNRAIRLENIYYDLDRSEIRPDAARELDKLVQILIDNPTINIELGSHTDSRADDEYNMKLSRRRAQAAVEYLVTVGGIDESRIVAHGYGETRLLNKCGNGVKCSEAEHQLNRRTEFTILKY